MAAPPTTFEPVTVSEPTAARLRAIARRRKAQEKRDKAIEADMKQAVADAQAEGGRLREIARLLEISHTAVAKVAHRTREDGR